MKIRKVIMFLGNIFRVFLYKLKNGQNRRKETWIMPDLIQTNQLTKTIDGKDLVKNVNIHVKKGEIYGFLGPN